MSEFRLDFPITVGSPAPLMAVATATDKIEVSAGRASTRMDQMTAALASIAQSSLRTNVTLQAMAESLEKTTVRTVQHTTAVAGMSAAHGKAVSDVQASGAAIRAFEGSMNVRAVEQFTTKILGLGNAFQVIFPLVGALATIEILVRIGEGIYRLAQSWSPAVQAAKEYLTVMQAIDSEVPALERQQRKIAIQIARNTAESNQKGSGTEAANRTEAGFLRQDARQPFMTIEGQQMSRIEIGNELRKQYRIVQLQRIPDEQGNFTTRSGRANAFQIAAAQTKITAYQSALDTLSYKSENLTAEAGLKDIEADNAARDRSEAEATKAAARARSIRAFQRSGFKLDEEAANRGEGAVGRILTRRQDEVFSRVDQAKELGVDSDAERTRVITDFNAILLTEFRKMLASARAELPSISGLNSDDSIFNARSKNFSKSLTAGNAYLDIGLKAQTRAAENDDRLQLRDLNRQSGRAERFAAAANGGPGNDLSIINLAYSERLRIAEKIFDIENNAANRKKTADEQEAARLEARGAREEEIDKAQEDRALKLLELRKRDQEKFVGQVEGGFRALVSGGGQGLAKYAQGQGLDVASTVVGNIARNTYKAGAFNIPGLSADSGIGKYLKGTPFVGGGTPEDKINTAGDKMLTASNNMLAAAGGGAPSIPLLSPSLSAGTLGALGLGGFGGLAGMIGPGGTSGFAGAIGAAGALRGGGTSSLFSDRSIQLGSGRATTLSSLIGPAVGIGAGTLGLMDGLKGGGVRGGLEAAGGAAGIAGGVASLASKFLGITGGILGAIPLVGAIAGPALQLITSFMGDPKTNRQNNINKSLATNTFYSPVAMNVNAGMNGGLSDYDRFGQSRSSSISPYPTTEAPYLDYRNGTYVPGRVTTDYGGFGPGGAGNGSGGGDTNLYITAMDTQSIVDRHQDILAAVNTGIDKGGQGTVFLDKMRQA